MSARRVQLFLRREQFQLASSANRADRAMRTRTARAKAASVHDELAHLTNGSETSDAVMLDILSRRPGWIRQDAREFVHAFGKRRSVISIPRGVDARQLIELVVRAEIAVLLGDCDWSILRDLQALAARELQQLAAESKRTTSGSWRL